MKRKILALILTLCMLLSMLPTAFAAQIRANNHFCLHYDMEGGCVFWSRGQSSPVGTEEEFVADGEQTGPVSQTNTVHFLLDPTIAADWDDWAQNGALNTHPSFTASDRAVYVQISYPTQNGWVNEFAVEADQVPAALADKYSYENGVLSFVAADASGEVDVNIWWTTHDCEYYSFNGGEGQILVQYEWNETEGALVYPDESVTVLGSCAQYAGEYDNLHYNRVRILVSANTEAVSFRWEGDVRSVSVESEGDENGWGVHNFPAQPFSFALDRVNENGDPWTFYGTWFDFTEEMNYELRVHYDTWGGSVFQSVGGGSPTLDAQDYLYDGDALSFEAEGQPAPVSLRFDSARGVDRGRYEQQGLPAAFVGSNVAESERKLYVLGRFYNAAGEWFDGWIVTGGALVPEMAGQFSLENEILSFTPANGCNMDFDVFWCQADYDYCNFGWDDDTMLIEFNAWGPGTLHWDESLETDHIYQPERDRGKILLPWSETDPLESLSFHWDGHLRTLGVFGLTEQWEQTEFSEPDFDSYTLVLDQTEEDGSPRRHYFINFDFAEDWNGLFSVDYDMNGGSVFVGYDGSFPEATAENYLPRRNDERPGWPSVRSFLDDDGNLRTIHLRLDEANSINWEQWDNNQVVFQESWKSNDRAPTVLACYNGTDGEWHKDILLLYGEEADPEAASYEDGVLTWLPPSGYELRFEIFWTRQDYDFSLFNSTEDKPVMVELNWWGNGTPFLQTELSAEQGDIMEGDGRMRIRVAENVQSLCFGWEGELRQINLDGGDGDWLNDIPHGEDSFTLVLDQTNEDGAPRDWYCVQFEFKGFPVGNDRMLRFNYDDNRGAVFACLGDDAEGFSPNPNDYRYCYSNEQGDLYLYDEDDNPLTIKLLFDERQAIDWEQSSEQQLTLRESDYVEDRSMYVFIRSNDTYGLVVADNELTELGETHGYEFEYDAANGVGRFRYTPSTDSDIELKLYWTREDYEFDNLLERTDEKPIMIQVDWWGDGSIVLPEIPAEDMLVQPERCRARIRVSEDTESLCFTWSEDDPMRQINVNGYQGYNEWYNDVPFEGQSYTLLLNAEWDDGSTRDWYHIQFEFEHGGDEPWGPQQGHVSAFFLDENGGSVFWALGDDTPALDAEHYLFFGMNVLSFVDDGEIRPVRLWFDEAHAPLWDEGDHEQLTGFTDSRPTADRALYVQANTESFNGLILAAGALTPEAESFGFAYDESTHILSFTPANRSPIILRWYWTQRQYDYDMFQGDSENGNPVLVEFNWDGFGEPIPPAGIDPENIFLLPECNTGRVRVPEDTEELVFTWVEDYGVNYVDVEGREPESLVQPCFSYTFRLDPHAEGEPFNDWYSLSFHFFPDSRYQLWIDWKGSEGNVYFGLNEAPTADMEHYVSDAPSCRVDGPDGPEIGTAYLLLDPHHSVPYFGGDRLYDLPDWEGYCPSVYLSYPLMDGTDAWFDGFVVENGALTAEGEAIGCAFTPDYEGGGCDLLCFTPKNEKPVIVTVLWSRENRDYEAFDGTEEKPVVVELMLGMRAPVKLPDEIPAEDVMLWHGAEHDYVKLRLPRQQSLELHWDHEGEIAQINYQQGWERKELRVPQGLSWSLPLDAENDRFSADFWAFPWAYTENRFDDVSEDAWYREAVLFADVLGITAGTSESSFSPNLPATRAQLVTFLWKYHGSPEPASLDNPFADVADDAWYLKAVLWAREQGITAGTSEGCFSPNDSCTRAQAVTFLWASHGRPRPSGSVNPFTDVKPGDYFRDAVVWAVEQGITAGTTETSFSPTLRCTRGHAVTFIFRDFLYCDREEIWD